LVLERRPVVRATEAGGTPRAAARARRAASVARPSTGASATLIRTRSPRPRG